MTIAEDIHKLAGARRSRANLEKIQAELTELTQNGEPMEDWGSEIYTLNTAVAALQEQTENIDNSIMPSIYAAKLLDALESLTKLLPGSEDPVLGLPVLISNAVDHANEYESSLDDRDVTAEEREETWGHLQQALTEIGDALDTLDTLGVPQQDQEAAGD
jgi:hypothetical protein